MTLERFQKIKQYLLDRVQFGYDIAIETLEMPETDAEKNYAQGYADAMEQVIQMIKEL